MKAIPSFPLQEGAQRLPSAAILVVALAAAFVLFSSPEAYAGGGGTEFNTLRTQLEEWIKGGLGKTVALAAVTIGAVFSVARSNPLPILSGIAFAIFQQYTPDIVDGILTGVVR